MTEISAPLHGSVRNQIARGTGRIETVDADPAGWESVIGETLVDLESLKPAARQFLCTLTTRGAGGHLAVRHPQPAHSHCRGCCMYPGSHRL